MRYKESAGSPVSFGEAAEPRHRAVALPAASSFPKRTLPSSVARVGSPVYTQRGKVTKLLTLQVFEQISGLVSRKLQVTELDPDTALVEYGMDSVRAAELVVELETLFQVEISDEQAAAMRTVRDIATRLAGLATSPAVGRSA
ncbi:acyl carrier protein [Nocardia altamirensis]|uniref:acyl carrier protein n=1 Tax=Nocardia altamirensis TaxID=472158 RepID=UPI00350E3E2A